MIASYQVPYAPTRMPYNCEECGATASTLYWCGDGWYCGLCSYETEDVSNQGDPVFSEQMSYGAP